MLSPAKLEEGYNLASTMHHPHCKSSDQIITQHVHLKSIINTQLHTHFSKTTNFQTNSTYHYAIIGLWFVERWVVSDQLGLQVTQCSPCSVFGPIRIWQVTQCGQ